MKARNIPLILSGLISLCLTLTGCYRNKILFDEARAKKHLIPIDTAKEYQQKFIASHEGLAKFVGDSSFLKNHMHMPNAESFNRDVIALLLNQDGADGIRIYYGEDDKGQIRLVLLPVDSAGHDIVTTLLAGTTAIHVPGISGAYAQGGGQAAETGQNCPPCLIK
jgi:hypothetical protein